MGRWRSGAASIRRPATFGQRFGFERLGGWEGAVRFANARMGGEGQDRMPGRPAKGEEE